MATKNKKPTSRAKAKDKKVVEKTEKIDKGPNLKQESINVIISLMLSLVCVLFLMAPFEKGGKVGTFLYEQISKLLGIGYYLIPLLFIFLAIYYLKDIERKFTKIRAFASVLFVISGLGLIQLITGKAGLLGAFVAKIEEPFGLWMSLIILLVLVAVSMIIIFDGVPNLFFKKQREERENEKLAEQGRLSQIEEEKLNKKIEDQVAKSKTEEEKGQKPEKEDKKEDPKKEKTIKDMLTGGIDSKMDKKVKEVFGVKDTPENLPSLKLLSKDKGKPDVGDIKANANIIKRTLANFGINVEMDEVSVGPTVTRYAFKPAEGVKLSKIASLQPDLALSLAAKTLRMETPIPGKSLVGIEIPNRAKTMVGLGTLFEKGEYLNPKYKLPLALGKDISGNGAVMDLAKAPHMLIAGATGAGKSVTVHALVNSLLFKHGPDHLKFIMVDPKRVEMTLYNGIPHLLTPVITDPKSAILALKWAVKEMNRRYDVLEERKVRDIGSYHENILEPAKKKGVKDGEEMPEAMPYIVVIIDEVADIMQSYPRELEAGIVQLAQMSRAVGIHLILSTQRPSVNVITGLIKANVPTRLALQVASAVDSKTILDQAGAEKLLGAGDMLYMTGDMSKPVRVQSAFISEDEVKSVVKFLKKAYINELQDEIDISNSAVAGDNSIFSGSLDDDDADDDLYEDAKIAVLEAGKASTSYLQRRLRVGYSRAARLIDLLEDNGVIGPANGSKPREILDTNVPDDEGEEMGEIDQNEEENKNY